MTRSYSRSLHWKALALAALLIGGAAALPAHARVVAGAEMPERIQVAGRTLELNGTAIKKALVFKLFVVGYYQERRTRSPEQALQSEQVKRIQLRILRSVTKDQVITAFREGLEVNGMDMSALRGRLDRLFASIPAAKAGDELSITYVPGEGTSIQLERGPGITLPGKDLADAIFSIWLGRNGEIAGIRRSLLGG